MIVLYPQISTYNDGGIHTVLLVHREFCEDTNTHVFDFNSVTVVFVFFLSMHLFINVQCHCLDPQAVGASKEEVLPTNDFLIPGLHIMLMTFAWGNSVH